MIRIPYRDVTTLGMLLREAEEEFHQNDYSLFDLTGYCADELNAFLNQLESFQIGEEEFYSIDFHHARAFRMLMDFFDAAAELPFGGEWYARFNELEDVRDLSRRWPMLVAEWEHEKEKRTIAEDTEKDQLT